MRANRQVVQRTLIRSALALLLARPQLLFEVEVPERLATLDKPGADVLRQMVELIRKRPQITASDIMDAFVDTPAHSALIKLSLAELPGDETIWRDDLETALAQLLVQADMERLRLLEGKAKANEQLTRDEKAELIALMSRRGRRQQS